MLIYSSQIQALICWQRSLASILIVMGARACSKCQGPLWAHWCLQRTWVLVFSPMASYSILRYGICSGGQWWGLGWGACRSTAIRTRYNYTQWCQLVTEGKIWSGPESSYRIPRYRCALLWLHTLPSGYMQRCKDQQWGSSKYAWVKLEWLYTVGCHAAGHWQQELFHIYKQLQGLLDISIFAHG